MSTNCLIMNKNYIRSDWKLHLVENLPLEKLADSLGISTYIERS